MYFAKYFLIIIWNVSVNQQENKAHSEENTYTIFFYPDKLEEFELF